jgi:two-component system, OmpR family, copper resistance phosphate regulon response regulator CusR
MTNKILVLDDENSIRAALSKVLHAEDYEVVSAENGQEAIEKFGAEKIDLLLLDLGLPVKDGWGTFEWLAKVNPLLPVIIITGRHAQRELAERAGADALMEKPLNVPRLLQTIRELINEPLESRAQRAKNRKSGFRYVSCDHELFREMLRERYTTPYLCPGMKLT